MTRQNLKAANPPRSKTSREIDRAVSKIYQVYGADLSAFLSSVIQKRDHKQQPAPIAPAPLSKLTKRK